MSNPESRLCMVNCITYAYPDVDRGPLDALRLNQLDLPVEDITDDDFFELQRTELEALLRLAGITDPVQHANISHPNPSIVENRIQEALSTNKVVFLALMPADDVAGPHIGHLTSFDGPWLTLDGQSVHIGLIYGQLFFHHRIDLFTLK